MTFNFDSAELAGLEPDAIAPAATPLLAMTAPETNPVFLAVADTGASGLVAFSGNVPAGYDPVPARRVWLGFHQNTVNVNDNDVLDPNNVAISPEGAILFQRTVQWLAGVPVTADGTAAGVALPDPGASVTEWSLY